MPDQDAEGHARISIAEWVFGGQGEVIVVVGLFPTKHSILMTLVFLKQVDTPMLLIQRRSYRYSGLAVVVTVHYLYY